MKTTRIVKEYRRRSRAFWCPGGYGFPNVTYSTRHMPFRSVAWYLAWWLMRRVVLGWMTPQGQARAIVSALGWYRPPVGGPHGEICAGGLYGDPYKDWTVQTGTSSTTTTGTIKWKDLGDDPNMTSDGSGGPFGI